MRFRKVKTGLLLKKAILYRVVVLITQVIFMWLITHDITFSIAVSIAWNILNTIEYFGFDYVFARMFRIGKDSK